MNRRDVNYVKALERAQKLYEIVAGKRLDRDIMIATRALIEGFENGVGRYDGGTASLYRLADFLMGVVFLFSESKDPQDFVTKLIRYAKNMERIAQTGRSSGKKSNLGG